MTILDTAHLNDDIGTRKIFLGTYSGFQRYDVYKYKFAKQIEAKMRNAFWNPEEISLVSDRQNFPELPGHIQEVLTQNLLFQTVMDSCQSRGMDSIMSNLTTSPEWEAVFRTQGYFEQIHSLSYSHIIREMYPDATEVFNLISEYTEIQNRVTAEVKLYDELTSDIYNAYDDDKKREKILELCVRIFALEGVKFYVSFLITYIINDSYGSKIQGFTRIIKLINFDEDYHVSVFGGLLNILKREESEGFVDLMNSGSYYKDLVGDVFSDVRKGEVTWGKYLMSFGNIPSLTPKVLENFVNCYVNDRMSKLKVGGPKAIFGDTETWFETYKNIDLDNVAGQEGEGLAYNVGIIKDDVPAGKIKIYNGKI